MKKKFIKNCKKLIALDLGTKTGIATRESEGSYDAILSCTGYICCDCIDLSKWDRARINLSNIKNPDYRFNSLYTFLNEILEPYSVVYYEQVQRHIGTYAAHIYGGLKAIMVMCCNNYNVPYIGVGVGTIKKHITGKGNATKQQVINAVNKKYMSKITNDNTADALALLDYAKWDLNLY